ncbi:MAG: KpsF/GutQ family sugar-phosphate isomerase [Verrucomicrobia bacterium]|nr:KpsF/GutQ family sugar-phosphate isomerase [Verrucomicrobiota bacterium]MBV9129797.1 KpsF/GutQ family sugar-phosphate isomerase [Verrucomicrobiota bacterium]MBV9298523.1 KpsF/GutQ family sugar-phosphate isomerase [Verrucomicrobiota bacterium]MBV9643454.1 KpsF/GutQ family sugar-phosphate isomerase [Verrucomicrobiota bacterium]
MDYLQKARRVLQVEISELQRLAARLDERFGQAVRLMLETVQAGRKVIVIGVGKSGQIVEKIAATLTSTGSPAFVLNPVNALHGDLGIVADGDVVIAASYSGETAELLNILPALKRFDIRIICFTGDPNSTLARHSEIVLDCSVEKEACPLNLAPTSSTTVMLALGDALAMVLLEMRGFGEDDLLKIHPGGRLGRYLLQRVRDIMRGEARMPIVSPETQVLAVLHSMNEHRAGVAVITDPSGKLAGIFTHGDFVRAFEKNPGMVSDPVEQHMVRHPITIQAHKLAVEVLNVLDQHRIDDLIVINQNDEPVGIVDSQDLTKLKLL